MTATRRRGRPSKRPRLHPFALTHTPLMEAIDGLSGIVESAGSGNLTTLLPSTSKGPLPSPELVLEEERGDEPANSLSPWDVVTLTLDPDLALDFLLSLPDRPPHGVAFGSSLRFWAEAAKFSLELLARQCFVPTLQKRDGAAVFRAAWEVVLAGENAERMRLLSRAMPPICRAFPGGGQPMDLVSNFLNQTVDAFVRENLSNKLLLPRRGRRTVPEQWLRALSSANPTLTAPAKDLSAFSSDLHAWLGQIRPIESPFRTCFRLEEDGSEWRISFHLQANDDPSLLVPAENVWRTRSGVATFLERRFENPQERLIADLGRASRLFPALEASLRTARPTELKLNTEQTYAFLRQSAPLLEQSGLGVLLPSWWQKPATRLGVKLAIRPKARTSTGLMGMDAIVSYDWKIALGDEALSLEEFEALADLKVPLVKVRGQWVELKPEEIEKAITFFKRKRGGEIPLGEALRIGLGLDAPDIGLPVVDVEADGWVKECLDPHARISTIRTPSTFSGKLRPYQRKGVSWLAFLERVGIGACLADDMGLGKTIELIALLLHAGKLGPTLLICPMSIVGNWQREIERFAPSIGVMVHHGAERLSGQAFAEQAKKHDVVITTYSLAQRDEELLSAVEWERVVLDEAQNIKNPSAKQTQAIKRLAAHHRTALTGTPVENQLSELWSIMEFLNPGYLGSGRDFRTRFALPIEKYRNASRAETLKRLIQPFVLRRLKTDRTVIKDLPEKMEMKVFCNLTEEQASLYEAVVKEMLERIENSEGIERKGLVLATLVKLKQVCNHPALFAHDGSRLPGRSGKLARLEEMLEVVLAEGDKALIFTQFAEMGTMLRGYLQESLGREVLFLHGGTPKRQRDAMVRRFQDDSHGPPLFILSLKAGGMGLNLMAANHVFHFDRWWNPAVENQATDRTFRIGQVKNVQVRKFVCVGTMEERIDQLIEQKEELAERIVGSGQDWITELSTAQLRELFALSRDAVSEGR